MRKGLKLLLLLWTPLIAGYSITRFYQLMWNPSTSMPEKLWLVKLDEREVKNNDYIVFKFHDYRMEDPFEYEFVVKQIAGSGGDKLTVHKTAMPNINWTYTLPEGSYPVYNKLSSYQFTPLTTSDLQIPAGYFFVHGNSQPSFDSRYREFGLVAKAQIYGKAYPLW